MTKPLPILRITTEHSEYVIDQNKGTFARRRRHEFASDLSVWGFGDEEANSYSSIMSPLEIGTSLHIATTFGGWIRSTPITSIEELSVASQDV